MEKTPLLRATYWEEEVAIEGPSGSPNHLPRHGAEERGHWCSIGNRMKVMNRMGETGVGGNWRNGRGLAEEPKKGCC